MAEIQKFEDSLKELETTVKKLEGDLPLDEAIEAFKRGVELCRLYFESLKAEKGKLSLLVDDINNLMQEFNLE